MAIEDPSGRRWEETVTSGSIAAVVTEVTDARTVYERAAEADALEQLAAPSADTCRHCPYRLVCGPYWHSLEVAWSHGSVAGAIDDARLAPVGSIMELRVESPIDAGGSRWIVSAVPESVAAVAGRVAVVDAELTDTPQQLRWRWSTMVRRW